MAEKMFTNEECQVVIHAIKGIAKAVKNIAEHVRMNLREDTFKFVDDNLSSSSDFMESTVFQLEQIKKRLRE